MELFTTESYYKTLPYVFKLQCGKKVCIISAGTACLSYYKICFIIYLETH